MEKSEQLNQLYERMLASLSACTRGVVVSTDLAGHRVESLDLMVKGFAAEMTAESLTNQLEVVQQDLAALKGKLDSSGEMSDMDTLRMQMTMDRLNKSLSTLSNILKKISDTAETIVQNLK
jgi:hypothetical protein